MEKWWNKGADRGRKRRMSEEEGRADDHKTSEDGQKIGGSSV